MLFVVSDVARLKGDSGGMISKLHEGYLISVDRALTQAYRQDVFDWLVQIDLSVVHQLCEHSAGKCFRDGSYFKDAIAVLDIY